MDMDTRAPDVRPPGVAHVLICLGPQYVSAQRITIQRKKVSSIRLSTTRIAYKIANPTHLTDPLFESPINKEKVMDEIQRLTPDKSPGPDGVTNRMLRSGGEKFNTILHKVIATLWEHQAELSEWRKLLMQTIYKSEGMIFKRLTKYKVVPAHRN